MSHKHVHCPEFLLQHGNVIHPKRVYRAWYTFLQHGKFDTPKKGCIKPINTVTKPKMVGSGFVTLLSHSVTIRCCSVTLPMPRSSPIGPLFQSCRSSWMRKKGWKGRLWGGLSTHIKDYRLEWEGNPVTRKLQWILLTHQECDAFLNRNISHGSQC
jgi:hypothetical protein